MRFFQSLTLLALSGLGLASPVDTSSSGSGVEARHWPGPWGYGQCLRKEDAQELVDAYVRMIRGWKDEDAKYLAESFTDWSDSINILAGKPLGSVTFPSKAAFVKKQQVAVCPFQPHWHIPRLPFPEAFPPTFTCLPHCSPCTVVLTCTD
jgi:hypothetical protein